MFLTRELAVGLLHLTGRCVGLDAEQLMRNEGLQGLNIPDDVKALVAEVPEEGEDGEVDHEGHVKPGEAVEGGAFFQPLLADHTLAVLEVPVDGELTPDHWLDDKLVRDGDEHDVEHGKTEVIER